MKLWLVVAVHAGFCTTTTAAKAASATRKERHLHVFLLFLRGMGTNTQSRFAPTHSNNHTVNN